MREVNDMSNLTKVSDGKVPMRVKAMMKGARVVKVMCNNRVDAVVGGKLCHFRSELEYRYANYLELLKTNRHIRDWQYEPKQFQFRREVTGAKVYTPDFRVVTNTGKYEYHEIKGNLTGEDITKLRRFAKQNPGTDIDLILQRIPGQRAKQKYVNRIEAARKYCRRVVAFKDVTKGLV
jgi:hypothetical protein